MAKREVSAPPVLAGFTYVRLLGTGGFADVFLYEQNLPRRQVAVKVLLAEYANHEVAAMFKAEADVMARLGSHPAIVTVYEASISPDGRPYIVMEYCPTVMTGRYRREVIGLPEALRVGVKVAGALESAHRSGVLHRDVKPSNVMATSYGTPVLSDFGIATTLQGTSGLMALSVPWSAPEVVTERTSGTIASEVWSLAATVYSLLAGRSPFEVPGSGRNSSEQLSERIAKAQYVPVQRDDIPAQVQDVLRAAMSLDPARRPQTAAEFGYQLQQLEYQLGLPVTALDIAQDPGAQFSAEHSSPVETVVRSEVPVVSERKKSRTPVRRVGQGLGDDVPVDAAAKEGSGNKALIGAVVGLVIVVIVLVTWIVLGS